MSKFKVGDKVTGVHSYFRSHSRVATVIPQTHRDFIRVRFQDGFEDGFDKDILTIVEGGAQMARKTYKLIKETPTVKKGAIYQEACDDGTQEYIILDKTFIKDTSGSGQVPIHTRSLVEDAPNWFVEVFQVEPQYMTREELDQWEAFKAKAKTPAAKTVALAVTKPGKRSWTAAQRKAHSAKIKAAWAAKKA